MKTVMILGAGVYQLPLILRAKKMGIRTIVVSIPGHYPGFEYADKVYYVDTTAEEEVLKIAKEEHINGIITAGTDVAMKTIGRINDELGLPGCSYSAAKKACNKVEMKKTFADKGVPTAQFEVLYVDTEKSNVIGICDQIGYPVVFKAIDSSGSRGITVVRSESEIDRAVDSIKSVTKQKEYIIEKYIVGLEFGAQAFIQNGKVEFVLPHGDYLFGGDAGVPIGHFAPLDNIDEEEVLKITSKAISALEIDNSAINMDFIISDGRIYVLEIGARSGATQLVELVSIYYGFDYYEKILIVALGENVSFDCSGPYTPNASHMLTSDKAGTIEEIINDTGNIDGIDEVYFDYSVGDEVRKFHVGPDRIGHVITRGKTLKEAEESLNTAMGKIEIRVV